MKNFVISLLLKGIGVNNLLLQILMMVIGNPELQEKLALPIGKALADALPDVTEDSVANFLMVVATKLKDQN